MLMQDPKFTNKADFLEFAKDKTERSFSMYDRRHVNEYEYLFFEFAPYYDITYYYDKNKNEIVVSEFYVGD